MKTKLVIGISFIVIFIATFILYLFIVSVVAPRFDLSSTAKQSIDNAPEARVNVNSHENNTNSINNQLNSFNLEGNDDRENIESSVKAPGESYFVGSQEEDDSEEVNEAIEEVADVTNSQSSQVGEESQAQHKEQIEQSAIPTPTVEVKLPSLDKPINDQKEPINRVFVGSYENVDQAKQAYDKVIDSGVDVAPIVKQVDGKYSLQMGAFSDKQKAKELADKLNQQNLSAKVKSE